MANIWQWAPKAARYRDPDSGRFVSRATIRQGVDQLIVASQRRITIASEELRSRKITLDEWQQVMLYEIKITQLMSEALLRGGWDQMTQADYDSVGERVKEQYTYLDGFTQDLANGLTTDGSFMSRARMYASAARVGFESGMAEQLLGVGYTEERNVLHPAEHCTDCVEATDRQWVPIGTNPPIGTRKCLGNDLCTTEYR